jgi:hypothetical protein
VSTKLYNLIFQVCGYRQENKTRVKQSYKHHQNKKVHDLGTVNLDKNISNRQCQCRSADYLAVDTKYRQKDNHIASIR